MTPPGVEALSTLQAMALVAAGMHVPLALTVWSMLHRRWHRSSLRLWVGGSVVLGTGGVLYAAEGSIFPWAAGHLASALLSVAPAMRIAALRLDLGWPVRAGLLATVAAVDFGGYLAGLRWLDEGPQMVLGFACMGAWNAAFAWHAAVAGRRLPSRSGQVLAGVEAVFAAALLLHALVLAAGWAPVQNLGDSWDVVVLVAAGLAAALYGNLGYLGLVLDRTSAAAAQAREAQLAEAVRRETAESHAAALDALLRQREQMFEMLAHEIRQPLHNVGGALQAASLGLGSAAPSGEPVAGAGPAGEADRLARLRHDTAEQLQRAQDVLLNVQSVLDNTLAAATLLARREPPLRVDTDLDFLVRLSLGDLPEAQRRRVRLRWHSADQSAELAPGLVRLALRNLLRNAFTHGGPAVQVTLEVADRAEPPELLLRVRDDGPGAPELLAAQAMAGLTGVAWPTATTGSDGAPAEPQRRGLDIVRQTMRLHGGRLELEAATGGGLVATLVFPQGG